MENNVAGFYNEFKEKQIKTGINIRHKSIFKSLKKAGLKPHHKVLEIGCGIGTVTKLLSHYITRGSILAVDISPDNISFAKNYIRNKNISFLVSDMSDFSTNTIFDFIILPDVLEHIPLENHFNIFNKISLCSKPSTTIFINIPSPQFQKFASHIMPEVQQIIDLEIHTDFLLKNAYENGFYLLSLETYSLWYEEGDYQKIVFKRKDYLDAMHKIPYKSLIWKELRFKISSILE